MKTYRTWMEWLSICFVAWICHRFLIPYGGTVMSVDGGVYPITADWIRQGHFAPFQINYTYGGNTLTFLRALWVELFERWAIGTDPRLYGHFTFSHGVVPILVATSFYILGRVFVSRSSAWMIGLISAVGFQSWVQFNHIEFYNSSLILGCLILALRGHSRMPLMDMSLKKLFWGAVLCGVAFYTYRATLIFIVAFFLPLPWATDQFKALLTPASRRERWVLTLAYALAALYFYLELFGADLGSIGGKRIKIHATPNLKLSLILLGTIWLGRYWRSIKREQLIRIGLVVAGILIGMLPELIYWIDRGSLPPLTGERNYSFADSFMVLGRVPYALKILFSSSEGLGALASLSLMCLAFFALYKNEAGRKNWSPVVISGAFAVFAFIRVFAYDVAPPRYLSPIFPMILVGVGLLLDRWKGTWLYGVAVFLIVIHSMDQLKLRHQFVIREKELTDQKCGDAIVDLAQKAGFEYVYSDDYGCANRLTVIAKWKPFFIPYYQSNWTLPAAVEGASRSPQVGVLLARPLDLSTSQPLVQRFPSLRSVGEVGGRFLYDTR